MKDASKALRYLGFALKSRTLRTGVNTAATLKEGYLVLLCATAGADTAAEAEKLARRLSCPLVVCSIPVAEIAHKENCKLAVLTEPNLAKAVLDNLDDNFTLRTGGK